MNGAKKKSRKKLYGLVVENLEDTTKSSSKNNFAINFCQKFINKAEKFYEEKECYINNKCVPLILEKTRPIVNCKNTKKEKHILPKIKKSKVTISYYKPYPKKKYFGSKTRKKKLSLQSESCELVCEYSSAKHKKNKTNIIHESRDPCTLHISYESCEPHE